MRFRGQFATDYDGVSVGVNMIVLSYEELSEDNRPTWNASTNVTSFLDLFDVPVLKQKQTSKNQREYMKITEEVVREMI